MCSPVECAHAHSGRLGWRGRAAAPPPRRASGHAPSTGSDPGPAGPRPEPRRAPPGGAQIIPALERALSLVGADVHAWFAALPRPQRLLPQKRPAAAVGLGAERAGGGAPGAATIDSYYLSRHCAVRHSHARPQVAPPAGPLACGERRPPGRLRSAFSRRAARPGEERAADAAAGASTCACARAGVRRADACAARAVRGVPRAAAGRRGRAGVARRAPGGALRGAGARVPTLRRRRRARRGRGRHRV